MIRSSLEVPKSKRPGNIVAAIIPFHKSEVQLLDTHNKHPYIHNNKIEEAGDDEKASQFVIRLTTCK